MRSLAPPRAPTANERMASRGLETIGVFPRWTATLPVQTKSSRFYEVSFEGFWLCFRSIMSVYSLRSRAHTSGGDEAGRTSPTG